MCQRTDKRCFCGYMKYDHISICRLFLDMSSVDAWGEVSIYSQIAVTGELCTSRSKNSDNRMPLLTPFGERLIHDDVIKWKHFPRYWPFVGGIHWSQVNSTHKGQWRGALMFSLICVGINGWNNRGAGDLWRHRVHYDVIVMQWFKLLLTHNTLAKVVKDVKVWPNRHWYFLSPLLYIP